MPPRRTHAPSAPSAASPGDGCTCRGPLQWGRCGRGGGALGAPAPPAPSAPPVALRVQRRRAGAGAPCTSGVRAVGVCPSAPSAALGRRPEGPRSARPPTRRAARWCVPRATAPAAGPARAGRRRAGAPCTSGVRDEAPGRAWRCRCTHAAPVIVSPPKGGLPSLKGGPSAGSRPPPLFPMHQAVGAAVGATVGPFVCS